MLKAGLASLCLAAAIAAVQNPAAAAAQNDSKPASSGVYTAEQAGRGKDVFAAMCTGCHTVATQSGEAFSKKWKGATLADLYRVLAEEMPKDDPGSLTEKERTDLIAYLLKINDIAPGTAPLTSDVEQLKKIVIDAKSGTTNH